MATIRWCPIFPKLDIYQPLIKTSQYLSLSHFSSRKMKIKIIRTQFETRSHSWSSPVSRPSTPSQPQACSWRWRLVQTTWVACCSWGQLGSSLRQWIPVMCSCSKNSLGMDPSGITRWTSRVPGKKNAAAFHSIWQCLGPKPKSPGCTPSLASEMLRRLEGLLEDTEVIQPKVELILKVGLSSNKCIFLQRLDTYPYYIYIYIYKVHINK